MLSHTFCCFRGLSPDAERRLWREGCLTWDHLPRLAHRLVSARKVPVLLAQLPLLRAALDGRTSVTIEDIRSVALPVLRHRIVTTYSAQADGQTPDTIIEALLRDVAARPGVNQLDGQVAQVFRS